MAHVVFENPGLLDPKSITAFGVSSKEKSNAIGFFGTGLKYALAILLREGCEVTIESGSKTYRFGKRKNKVRVDEFEFVTMNNRSLSFTTELGKNWELWQAFRELYCNCMDEDGKVFETKNQRLPAIKPKTTRVIVRGPKFLDVYRDRESVILDSKPLHTHPSVEIHSGESEFLYYRGVRAYRLHEKSMFTYNIMRKVDLTEDRTIKYLFEAEAAIRHGWMTCEDPVRVNRVLTVPNGTYEKGLNFQGVMPGDVFLSCVRTLASKFDSRLNDTARAACEPWLLPALPDEGNSLTDVQAQALERSIEFCKQIGFQVDAFPIIVTDWLGEEVLGRAANGRIYLTSRVFMMGTKMIAGTLLEEYMHLRYEVRDTTRNMQNFLMDTIVSLGERLTGQAL